MSEQDRSSFFLRDFEPSAVRLKRKLRLILNKNLRQEKLSNKNVTLTEFIAYLILLIIVTIICTVNRVSQDLFYADRCIRRLLINKLELYTVKTIDQFWTYLDQFNDELYNNARQLKSITNNKNKIFTHQILLSDENFILGSPRLRQIRVDNSQCQIIKDLSKQPVNCYVPYDKSKEYRSQFISITGQKYNYISPKATAAFELTNKYGPYDTGGFMYYFDSEKDMNHQGILNLKQNEWLNISTRAVFIEFMYFNPNTELLTSINIMFEFLTTGMIESKDFFYTIPINSYFFGRKSWLSIFQVLFILYYILFTFYYIAKISEHRLWFIMSSYWNVYDLGLLILFTISISFDIQYLMSISHSFQCLSLPTNDIYKELISFFEIQRNRINIQAYLIATVLIRFLRYLPHFSHLIANLLNVFYGSIRNSIGFLLFFFLIFMSFVVFATFHYGNELYEFHTFALTAYTLARCTLGQFEYDRAYRVSPAWTPIFYMLYVCVIFFVLLNLLIAVINETYVLGRQEQKQIEDDLYEEYSRGKKNQRLNTLRRSKQPVLQGEFIRLINHFLTFFFNKSIDLGDGIDVQSDQDDNNDDDDDDSISLQEKQTIITEKLRKSLRNEGYGQEVIEKFFQRVLGDRDNDEDDDDDDLSLLKMEENQIMQILYDEFKIFNNQYEKLAQDWRKTAKAARELVLVNSIDIEQATLMKNHLNNLDQRIKTFESIIPKLLKNIVELYK
ncbi:hypothetical protein I4U23_006495 [Adineta vaga]|nr:hypothetical protein I4U23_006495 [Adineta vaga]